MSRWINAALRRAVVYGFPVVFVVVEHLLRLALERFKVPADPRGFIPPTLAAAGIGQLFPVVAPKDRSNLLPKSLVRRMRAMGLTGGTSEVDQALVTTAWICIFLLTVVWAVLVYSSIQMSDPDTMLFGIKTFYLGLSIYFVGVVLAEAKEWV
jgi:hypothetical protein